MMFLKLNHHFTSLLLLFLLITVNGAKKKKPTATSQTASLTSTTTSQKQIGQIHQLFIECAVMVRNSEGSSRSAPQTLFAHAKMGGSAVFFDMSRHYNGYVAKSEVIESCNEDQDANKSPAIKVSGVECNNGGKKGTIKLELAGGKSNVVLKYDCNMPECHSTKYVLVEWQHSDGGPEISKIYYMDKESSCLRNKFKTVKKMEQIYESSKATKRRQKTEDPIPKNADKKKMHKLIQECAVKRKDTEAIETMVRFIQLSATKTLFFSKAAHLYIAKNSEADVQEVCVKDKSAKLKVPVESARLMLSANELMLKYGKDNKQERLYLNKRGPVGNRYCLATTKEAKNKYNVFLCPSNVCGNGKMGTEQLLLLHKDRTGTDLLKMDQYSEDVHVDHMYLASIDKQTMKKVQQYCGSGVLGIVDGIQKDPESAKKKEHKRRVGNGMKTAETEKNEKRNQQESKESKESNEKTKKNKESPAGNRGSNPSHQEVFDAAGKKRQNQEQSEPQKKQPQQNSPEAKKRAQQNWAKALNKAKNQRNENNEREKPEKEQPQITNGRAIPINNAKPKSQLAENPEFKRTAKNDGQTDKKEEKGPIPSHRKMFATADKNQKKVEQPQKSPKIEIKKKAHSAESYFNKKNQKGLL